MNWLLLAMNAEQKTDLKKAFEIFWKGMVAVVLTVVIIMAITYIMQAISKKAQSKNNKNNDEVDFTADGGETAEK